MSKNPNCKSNDDGDEEEEEDDDDDGGGGGDDDETLRRGCCVKRLTRHMASSLWGGGLSPGRSGIRGPAPPFASQSKTQGSPLGGYLSWSI